MTPNVDPAAYRRGRIVWAALLLAVGQYYFVLGSLLPDAPSPVDAEPARLRTVFFALAAAAVVLIVLFERGVIPLQSDRKDVSVAFTRHIICWAFAESVALYGFALAFLTRRRDEAYVFLVLAAGLLLWLRPRPERFPLAQA